MDYIVRWRQEVGKLGDSQKNKYSSVTWSLDICRLPEQRDLSFPSVPTNYTNNTMAKRKRDPQLHAENTANAAVALLPQVHLVPL